MAQIETTKQAVIGWLISAILLAYCLWGALQNRLWFPSKTTEVYMSGISAWALVAGSGAWLVSFSLLVQEMRGHSPTWGARVGGPLLLVGVALMIAARFFLPGVIYVPVK